MKSKLNILSGPGNQLAESQSRITKFSCLSSFLSKTAEPIGFQTLKDATPWSGDSFRLKGDIPVASQSVGGGGRF